MDFTEYERKNSGGMKMKIDDDTNHIVDFLSYQTINYCISAVISIITILYFLSLNGVLQYYH